MGGQWPQLLMPQDVRAADLCWAIVWEAWPAAQCSCCPSHRPTHPFPKPAPCRRPCIGRPAGRCRSRRPCGAKTGPPSSTRSLPSPAVAASRLPCRPATAAGLPPPCLALQQRLISGQCMPSGQRHSWRRRQWLGTRQHRWRLPRLLHRQAPLAPACSGVWRLQAASPCQRGSLEQGPASGR